MSCLSVVITSWQQPYVKGTQTVHTQNICKAQSVLHMVTNWKATCAALRRVIDESEDQDSTDLQKCINCARALIASRPEQLHGASIFAAGSPLTSSSAFQTLVWLMWTLLLCIEHDESGERSRKDYCMHPDDPFQPACCSTRTQDISDSS